jgi:hypothetical protein
MRSFECIIQEGADGGGDDVQEDVPQTGHADQPGPSEQEEPDQDGHAHVGEHQPKLADLDKKSSGLREDKSEPATGSEVTRRLRGFKRPAAKKEELLKTKRNKQTGDIFY